MEKERLIKLRFEEAKETIKNLWLDLLTLTPHLSEEERKTVVRALEQCKQAVEGKVDLD